MKKDPIKIKPSHKGLLHEDLGVPEGKKLTQAELNKGLHSEDPKVRSRTHFALNARKWDHE